MISIELFQIYLALANQNWFQVHWALYLNTLGSFHATVRAIIMHESIPVTKFFGHMSRQHHSQSCLIISDCYGELYLFILMFSSHHALRAQGNLQTVNIQCFCMYFFKVNNIT